MPRALGVADAEDFDAVAAPPQHLLRRLRLQPCDQADDLAGADIERRDDRRAARRHRLHLRGEAVVEAHAEPPFFLAFLSLSASWRAAQASSDSRTVTRSGRRRSIAVMSRVRILSSRSSWTSVSSACSSPVFRQPHVDAVVEHHVPAPLRHQDGRAQPVADQRILVEQRQEVLGAGLGAGADHQRQIGKTLGHVALDHGAVIGDHRDLAVLLPQRERLALGDRDVQPAGIELEHGRLGDPGIGLEPGAGLGGVEEQQRRASGDAGGGQNFLARKLALAGERDRGDAEAERVGDRVAQIAQLGRPSPARARRAQCQRRRLPARRRSRPQCRRRAAAASIHNGPKPSAAAWRSRRVRLERTTRAATGATPAAGRACAPSVTGSARRLRPSIAPAHRNVMPAYVASSGTSEVSVMPGCVLTSRQTKPSVPALRSS